MTRRDRSSGRRCHSRHAFCGVPIVPWLGTRRPRPRRLLAAGVLVTVVLAPAVVVPASAATRLPVVAGVTELRGSTAGMVRVRVDRPAVLRDPLEPAFRNDLVATGGGRFAGFALVADTPGLTGLTIVGGRLPAASGAGNVTLALNGAEPNADGWAVPAGTYRLYLLADGQPAVVRLRFHGLAGSIRLTPTSRRTLVVREPAPVADAAPARVVYTAGGDNPVPGQALYFHADYMRYEVAHVATQYMGCFYRGKPEGPAPYAPGCPWPLSDRDTPVFVLNEAPGTPSPTATCAQRDGGAWRSGRSSCC
jgi:hypothetical protein